MGILYFYHITKPDVPHTDLWLSCVTIIAHMSRIYWKSQSVRNIFLSPKGFYENALSQSENLFGRQLGQALRLRRPK